MCRCLIFLVSTFDRSVLFIEAFEAMTSNLSPWKGVQVLDLYVLPLPLDGEPPCNPLLRRMLGWAAPPP